MYIYAYILCIYMPEESKKPEECKGQKRHTFMIINLIIKEVKLIKTTLFYFFTYCFLRKISSY